MGMRMAEQTPAVRFFIGGNTPDGFLAYLDDLYDGKDGWQAYILKSGPGTGKSSLMRRVMETMAAAGHQPEAIFCASDPGSLDGVIFRDVKKCIFDGTAPHVLEPKYWGGADVTVPLDSCIDPDKIRLHQAEVIEATDACADAHRRCRGFLRAAASLLSDTAKIAALCTDTAKVKKSACRLAEREFGGERGKGKEWRRFLSAVTPEGLLAFHDTLGALCPRIISLEDEYGVAAPLFLATLRRYALESGLEIISCACPLNPDKLEHLMIPQAGLALTTSNTFHKADFPVYRRIHASRFTDTERIRLKKQIIAFNRRAARELLYEAAAITAAAKKVHDTLEGYYAPAMDWSRVNTMTSQMVKTFLKE